MSQDNLIKLKSSQSDHHYLTYKNKKKNPNKMEVKKYDPTIRKHTKYKEVKK